MKFVIAPGQPLNQSIRATWLLTWPHGCSDFELAYWVQPHSFIVRSKMGRFHSFWRGCLPSNSFFVVKFGKNTNKQKTSPSFPGLFYKIKKKTNKQTNKQTNKRLSRSFWNTMVGPHIFCMFVCLYFFVLFFGMLVCLFVSHDKKWGRAIRFQKDWGLFEI